MNFCCLAQICGGSRVGIEGRMRVDERSELSILEMHSSPPDGVALPNMMQTLMVDVKGILEDETRRDEGVKCTKRSL